MDTKSTLETKKARKNPARRRAAQTKTQDANSPLSRNSSASAATEVVQTRQSDSAPKVESTRSLPDLNKPSVSTEQANTVKNGANPSKSTPNAGSKAKIAALAAPAVVTGGLLGCAAGAALLMSIGIWYDYAGVETAVLAAKAAKLCLNNLADEIIASLKAGTYSADEALDILRRTTLAYASTIPGGTAYVERIFREINLARRLRGQEVDRVLQETYAELSRAGKRGATADQMRGVVIEQLSKLSGFAGNTIQDVVDRNPSLKPYREGALKSLQGTPEPSTPTIKLNVVLRQKKSSA